jgi:phage RecT family recombinase
MSQPATAVVRFEATLAQVMPKVQAGFPLSIPEHKLKRATDRLMFAIKGAATANRAIYECTAASVAHCICLSAITGLLPGGAVPLVDLIPRNRRSKDSSGRWGSVKELNWQIGWRGYQALGERCGADLEPRLVFVGDKYESRYGLNPDLVHIPDPDVERTWENVLCAYIIIRLPNGRVRFTDLTKAQIEKRRNNSQSWSRNDPGKRGPWEDWPLEMALKTIIKYAAQRGLFPLDEEFGTALTLDGREPDEDAIVTIDTTATAVPELKEVEQSGMGALSDHLEQRPAIPPIQSVLNIEQPPSERLVGNEVDFPPAGESIPQPTASDLPLGGGSPPDPVDDDGYFNELRVECKRLEEYLPREEWQTIRGGIPTMKAMRSNASLDRVEDMDVLIQYRDLLQQSYSQLRG